MEDWAITPQKKLLLQLQNIKTETAIFIAKKYEKPNKAVIETGIIISFILNILPEI